MLGLLKFSTVLDWEYGGRGGRGGTRYRFSRKAPQKLSCRVVALYNNYKSKNSFKGYNPARKFFAKLFFKKAEIASPASLHPQHPTMNYNYIKTPSAFGVVNSDAESAFQRKHFIR